MNTIVSLPLDYYNNLKKFKNPMLSNYKNQIHVNNFNFSKNFLK